MIKAVLFDMDGLVLDSEIIYDRAMKTASEKIGYPLNDNFLNLTRGANGETFKELVLQVYGLDFPLEEFQAEYKQEFYKIIACEGVKVKQGFHNLMKFLNQNHIKYCLVTSSTRKMKTLLLEAAGIPEIFPYSICGDEVVYSKPDPYIYLKACKKLGELPENCMVLEDSKNGLVAGKAAGCMTVLIPDLMIPDVSMLEKSDYVIKDLDEVIPLISMQQDKGHC